MNWSIDRCCSLRQWSQCSGDIWVQSHYMVTKCVRYTHMTNVHWFLFMPREHNNSAHSSPPNHMQVSGQHHAPAAWHSENNPGTHWTRKLRGPTKVAKSYQNNKMPYLVTCLTTIYKWHTLSHALPTYKNDNFPHAGTTSKNAKPPHMLAHLTKMTYFITCLANLYKQRPTGGITNVLILKKEKWKN